MLFDTIAEYNTEIANVREAIVRQLKLGSSTSTQISGNGRQATEVSLGSLRSYLRALLQERDMLDTDSSKTGSLLFGCGW